MRKLFAVLLLASLFLGQANAGSDQPPPAVSRITELGGSALKNGGKDAILVYVPPGADLERNSQRLSDELNRVKDSRGLVLIAGSEDTTAMAKLVISAFQNIEPNRLAGATFVFVGATQDSPAVKSAVSRSGAKYLFAEFTQ